MSTSSFNQLKFNNMKKIKGLDCKDFQYKENSAYSVKQANSGDYAQQVSSGYGVKHEVNGEKSVCAAIGNNSKVKAFLGTWKKMVFRVLIPYGN